MQQKYNHSILKERNSIKSAIPWLSSAIDIRILIIILMHKEKQKVLESLYVSNYFFFSVMAVN